MKLFFTFYLTFLFFASFGQLSYNIDLEPSGKQISTELLGAFFEDINYAADGGLYAELIQNRSFEYYPVANYVNLDSMEAWSVISKGFDASASLKIKNINPLNSTNLNYVQLKITNAGEHVGINNSGFDGISIRKGEKYNYSFYVRNESNFTGNLVVRINSPQGITIASDTISSISSNWQKISGQLTSSLDYSSANFSIICTETGTLNFDMISLFPEKTFKNRENGLRPDLAQAIADLNPQFVRFPGGCISHGRGLDNAYRWKHTVGDVAERKANWNLWGYHQTYGLGFYEYFLFCEDIDAIPLPVVPVGVSCQFREREIEPLSNMQKWIDDALDLIEFANGDSTTTWGRKRIEMGHPEPFNMEYICLGNEEDDIPEFRERFNMIKNALRDEYPEIKIIGTSGTNHSGSYFDSLWEFSTDENLDAVDEHYYVEPGWLLDNTSRYDNYDRSAPKVFLGEYASRNDLYENALAEATFLTGVERNADVIQFSCYAPLLCNVKHSQWDPDLIRFNNSKVVKTANYYVQQMYGVYAGDEYINSKMSIDDSFESNSKIRGAVGVGTWNTTADFDDLKITSGDQVLFQEDFSSVNDNWNVIDGTFNISNGVYQQTANTQPAYSIYNGNIETSEVVIEIKARKTGGAEGFIIPFGYKDANNYYWLNIGGWNNTQHAIEVVTNGSKSQVATQAGSINSQQWYDIKIVSESNSINIYLDDVLLFTMQTTQEPIETSVVRNNEKNELYLKIANPNAEDYNLNFNLSGKTINQSAKKIMLLGALNDRNSIENPLMVTPMESFVQVGNSFNINASAHSFQVIVLKLDGIYNSKNSIQNSENHLKLYPNPTGEYSELILEDKDSENAVVKLFDTAGNIVNQAIISKEGNKIRIERNGISAGVYILNIRNQNKMSNSKLIFID